MFELVDNAAVGVACNCRRADACCDLLGNRLYIRLSAVRLRLYALDGILVSRTPITSSLLMKKQTLLL